MSALDEALWPRASLPRRPMLGAVLDALTVTLDGAAPPSFWIDEPAVRVAVTAGDGCAVVSTPALKVGYRWTTTDPAEAWEILDARGLIPEGYVGRFVCGVCSGRGGGPGWGAPDSCGACAGQGHTPHPPTVAALASWVSLGFAASDDGVPGILGAEELAREIADSLHVWWGVIDRPPQELRGLDPDSPGVRLRDAGIRWYWQGGTVDRTTLYVPPL